MGEMSLLFVLLFEFKILCCDPISTPLVDSQSSGSMHKHAQQTSTQTLNCSRLTFQLERKVRKRETCSEARSPMSTLFFYRLHMRPVKSSS